jgi:transposase-like protein
LCDRNGLPLHVLATGANTHDSTMLAPLLDTNPAVREHGGPGRPRRRPGKLHADKGYDYPRCRRYSEQEKAAAVRMVRTLRAELGTEHGTVKRVADQLGYGVESVRLWVRQADIDDGHEPGVTTAEAARVRELEQEVRELRRANEIPQAGRQFLRVSATMITAWRGSLFSSVPAAAVARGAGFSAMFCTSQLFADRCPGTARPRARACALPP